MRHRALLAIAAVIWTAAAAQEETAAQHDARMQWWREARFGLFIHWGLYAVPAGEWEGRTDHGEWIRTTARIPLKEYDRFTGRFAPRRFDPDAWVRAAKEAGMKYIVITTKHHDGFCLFDTKETTFSVMSTPFHRDVMKALSEACARQGMKICWYYSIMDWHHSDYLPRREWETDRPSEGADFPRYIACMKAELKELLTRYGPIGVLWFDGEWESTWNTTYGRELYRYVRSLQPSIIINNRVGAGRSGMEGFTKEGEFGGDFGTPEQEVPPTGLPGVDWETCMTMNDHWGYCRADTNWKSPKELLRTLVDIASKGGNFLLNIGPTAEGLFPDASLARLRAIGDWMSVNGESIHGTSASPFARIPWGRCTEVATAGGVRLYLHVFDWPADGNLVVPGVSGSPERAYLMAVKEKPLVVGRREDALILSLPARPPDSSDAVVVLEFRGPALVHNPPVISAPEEIFVDRLPVTIASGGPAAELRYTTDGSLPGPASPLVQGPVVITGSATVAARAFIDGKPVSPASSARFRAVAPRPAPGREDVVPGISYAYYQGTWDSLPDFSGLAPVQRGELRNFTTPRLRPENYGFLYEGYLAVPATGVYAFMTESDDGSRLCIDGDAVVNNDGTHGMKKKRGAVALGAGLHRLRLEYFNRAGGAGLNVFWQGPGVAMSPVPDSALARPR